MSDKIIDKIRKLQLQSESAKKIGNENEALAFAEKAQNLMIQYQIEISELQIPDDPIYFEKINWNEFNFETTYRRQSWIETLSSLIANKNGCKIANQTKSNNIYVYGTEINRKITIHIIGNTVSFINKIADQKYRKFYYECKKNDELFLTKGFKKSFLWGFIRALNERYVTISDEKSLQVVGKELSRVQEFMKDLNKSKPTKRVDIINYDGYNAGQESANNIEIERKDNRLECSY